MDQQVQQALKQLEQIDEQVRQIAGIPETDETFGKLIKEKETLIDQIKRETGDEPYWTFYGYSLR